jgi:hypothetical protein
VPQIRVIAYMPSDAVTHSERVNLADFKSEQFRTQLAERLAWAVGDADAVERACRPPYRRSGPQVRHYRRTRQFAPTTAVSRLTQA